MRSLNVKTLFEKCCLPIYFIDETFYKCNVYDGVVIQLCDKHGYGGSLRLMAIWVPIECTEHYVFFLLSMKSINLDIKNIPFMADRGHLLTAARFLHASAKIIITLKFTLKHIIRNVTHKFKIHAFPLAKLRNIISAM